MRGETRLPVDSILISQRKGTDKGSELRRETGRKMVRGVMDRWTGPFVVELNGLRKSGEKEYVSL